MTILRLRGDRNLVFQRAGAANGKHSFNRAFTLIEILVVIAIIAVIAAILFPVFSRARENARRASCQSNLKQIALGIKMYSQDYDNVYPQQLYAGSAAHGWADAIFPYTRSVQIQQCPSESKAGQSTPMPAQIGYTDYAYNANLSGKNESDFTAASVTILNCEGISFSSDQPKDGDNDIASSVGDCDGDSTRAGAVPGIYLLIQTGQIFYPDVSRHFGGGNYSFVDGHVKWLKPQKIYNWCTAPRSDATFAYK